MKLNLKLINAGKWILLIPTIVISNLLIRIPIVWIYSNILPSFFGFNNQNLEFTWFAIVMLGIREFASTYISLYLSLKFIKHDQRSAFYTGIIITVLIFLAFLYNYPIRFIEIGFWGGLYELALLAGQLFGIYKAIDVIKDGFNLYSSTDNTSNYTTTDLKTHQTIPPQNESTTLDFWTSFKPDGYFDDPSDRCNNFENRLEDSIFKSIENAEAEIIEKFNINPNDVIYEVCIVNKWIKNVGLEKIKELTYDYINKFGDDDFFIQIVINCKKQITSKDVQIWGTVIDINYRRYSYYSQIDEQEYLTWYYAVELEESPVNIPFTSEQFYEVTKQIIRSIESDYNEYYS